MAQKLKKTAVQKYMDRVNKTLYPGLIDAAEEWVEVGWGHDDLSPPKLATAIMNEANDRGTTPLGREQMLTIALNILNFHYRGDEWMAKPLPE